MKTITLLIAILFAACLNNNYAQGTWKKKANFGGTKRYGAVGFSIGSKGYIGTGYDGVRRNDFWEYDPATDVWTQKANFGGTVRYFAVGFSIGSKGYIGTGTGQDGSDEKNDFWEYNPSTNAWARKADFGGGARHGATGFSIGSKGYIGTGTFNFITSLNDFWEYDPATNAWVQKADFGGTTRWGAVGFSIGNKGYIGTGTNDGDTSYYNDFWEYDPATNGWTQRADFEGGTRGYAVGFSIDSKGYLGTGTNNNQNQNSYFKDFWEYEPATNAWTQKANFGGTKRLGATGFSIGSKGYLGTGILIATFFSDFWEYDPATDAWTQKAYFGGAERLHAPGFSIGSKGYIGTGAPNTTKDFWEYTPDCYQNITVYADADGDGYGNVKKSKINPTCDLLAGYVPDSTDCNDTNASIHPNATETFNGIDDNCNGLIDEITGLSTTNITATTATFNWSTLPGTDRYIIKYRRMDSTVETSWRRIRASFPVISITVGGLIPNSKYKWIIRSFHDSVPTDFSGPVRFKTAAALAINQQNKSSVKAAVKEFVVYPNPTTGNVTINLTLAKKQSLFIKVFDVTGKEVYSSGEGMVSGTFSKQVNLGKLSPGAYFLKVVHDRETEVKAIVLKK